MPDPIAITHHSGCIEHPEHITTDALAALARSQGATEHHVILGEDGRRWFEWWQRPALAADTPLWPYPTQRSDETQDL
jgi:hypothetical protein